MMKAAFFCVLSRGHKCCGHYSYKNFYRKSYRKVSVMPSVSCFIMMIDIGTSTKVFHTTFVNVHMNILDP